MNHLLHLIHVISSDAPGSPDSYFIFFQVQVAGGKVVATRHVLQKGVPDIVGHKFDAELADLLEGSYKTRVLASNLRKIIWQPLFVELGPFWTTQELCQKFVQGRWQLSKLVNDFDEENLMNMEW